MPIVAKSVVGPWGGRNSSRERFDQEERSTGSKTRSQRKQQRQKQRGKAPRRMIAHPMTSQQSYAFLYLPVLRHRCGWSRTVHCRTIYTRAIQGLSSELASEICGPDANQRTKKVLLERIGKTDGRVSRRSRFTPVGRVRAASSLPGKTLRLRHESWLLFLRASLPPLVSGQRVVQAAPILRFRAS